MTNILNIDLRLLLWETNTQFFYRQKRYFHGTRRHSASWVIIFTIKKIVTIDENYLTIFKLKIIVYRVCVGRAVWSSLLLYFRNRTAMKSKKKKKAWTFFTLETWLHAYIFQSTYANRKNIFIAIKFFWLWMITSPPTWAKCLSSSLQFSFHYYNFLELCIEIRRFCETKNLLKEQRIYLRHDTGKKSFFINYKKKFLSLLSARGFPGTVEKKN